MRGPAGPWGWHELDARWVARLVAAADVRSGDLVLDVGAGTGAITAQLVRAGARVVAFELHPRRAALLQTRFSAAPVTVVRADASDLRLPRRPFKVVANPPFGVTTSLLRRLTSRASRLQQASLVVPTWAAALGERPWRGRRCTEAGLRVHAWSSGARARVPTVTSGSPADPADQSGDTSRRTWAGTDSTVSGLVPIADGIVTIRPPEPGDAARIVAARDEVFHRWMGEGSPEPVPTACIVVDGSVVGWVDNDRDQSWLAAGEVNMGYMLFPDARGRGCATRAVQLLLHHLAVRTDVTTAKLLIDRDNERSLAVADRAGFAPRGDRDHNTLFARPVPPLRYSDGVVTMRRPEPEDLDADLEAKDDEQIRWLWLPGQREQWLAKTAAEQREHARQGLAARIESFGRGPKWTFSIDAADARYVTYVDVDLANPDVPRGEANISYSTHPAHRARGYASRAVALALRFLADHTGAREAHIVVDPENVASARVAANVGAPERDRFVNARGETMIRHVVAVPRADP